MAKKKIELTVEEMLEEALVREEDWPYEVPGNWVWTRLNFIAQYKKGPFGSSITKAMFVPKSDTTYKVYEQGVAIRKDVNYGTYYITEEKYKELKGFKVYPGDLIVSCAGTVGETYQLPDDIEPGIINQALMRVKINSNMNLQYFLMYFDEILRDDIRSKSKGTAIKNIPPFSVLKLMPYPLPPLAEQQRIVDRIQSLFEKLAQAKELIQEVLDIFENRKAAILNKAFTGELTKKWREVNGVGLESWEETTLGETIVFRKKKYDPSKEIKSLSYIGLEHIEKNRGIVDIGNSEDIKSLKSVFQKGDILYGKLRPYLNKHDVALIDGICSTDILVLRAKDGSTAKYLNYMFDMNSFISYAIENSNGINLPRVSEKVISKFKITLPTLFEQQEIGNILDDLLEKEQSAKELYDQIVQIESMKKTILGQAFRGELGTNVTKEGSAIELLKSMFSESGEEMN